jgi:hypothetical protein
MRQGNSGWTGFQQLPFLDVCNGEKRSQVRISRRKSVTRKLEKPPFSRERLFRIAKFCLSDPVRPFTGFALDRINSQSHLLRNRAANESINSHSATQSCSHLESTRSSLSEWIAIRDRPSVWLSLHKLD